MKRLILTLALVVCAFCAHAQTPTILEVFDYWGNIGEFESFELPSPEGGVLTYNTITYFLSDGQINTFICFPYAKLSDSIIGSAFRVDLTKIDSWLTHLDEQYTKIEYMRWVGQENQKVWVDIESDFFIVWMTYEK